MGKRHAKCLPTSQKNSVCFLVLNQRVAVLLLLQEIEKGH